MEHVINKLRGYVVEDDTSFSGEKLFTCKKAHEEVIWLLNREYPLKNVLNFVSNRYLLSERQKNAILKSVCTEEEKVSRINKKLDISNLRNKCLNIHMLNLINILEVILSNGYVIFCYDECYRDLSDSSMSYRIGDKTQIALSILQDAFNNLKVKEVTFWMDSSIPNTEKLRSLIFEALSSSNYKLNLEVISNIDSTLSSKENVITCDSVALDACKSYINLIPFLVNEKLVNLDKVIKLY